MSNIQLLEEVVPHLTIRELDSALYGTHLDLRATYYPLGFPVEVITNDRVVLEGARESWRRFAIRRDYAALTIRLEVAEEITENEGKKEGVTDRRDVEVPSAPVCRMSGHLLANVADSSNFLIADFNEGCAFGRVTRQTVQASRYFRYHMLEAAALSMIAGLRAAPIHGACVATNGNRALLLCGDSGAGKSSLAYAAACAGWTYICDDASYLLLENDDCIVAGNCHQFRFRAAGLSLFPELARAPITPRAAGKPAVEIPTAVLPKITTSETAHIGSIVFLNRQCGDEHSLNKLSRESVWPWFEKHLFQNTISYPIQQTAIERLLDHNIFELRYQSLPWAIERLQTLSEAGR